MTQQSVIVSTLSIISASRLEEWQVKALKALAAAGQSGVTVDYTDRLTTIKIPEPVAPRPPGRVAKYQVVSAAIEPKDLLRLLGTSDEAELAAGIGVEIVGSDWREVALIARNDRQVSLAVRLEVGQPASLELRGLAWDEFSHHLVGARRGVLAEVKALVSHGPSGVGDFRTLEQARAYTHVRPPEEWAAAPPEDKVSTGDLSYEAKQFLRDWDEGKTDWFVVSGPQGQLAIVRRYPDGDVSVACRSGFGGLHSRIIVGSQFSSLFLRGRSAKAFDRLLRMVKDGGREVSVPEVMCRTGFHFA